MFFLSRGYRMRRVTNGVHRYYPIGVRLEGRPVVVIGGGKVAERKIARLLESAPRSWL